MSETITVDEAAEEPVLESTVEAVSDEQLIGRCHVIDAWRVHASRSSGKKVPIAVPAQNFSPRGRPRRPDFPAMCTPFFIM
ncbi:hypothetical protein [Streptomyces sp. NPDC086023]|uniref:hypothetical protein n=1 Tax=Streptomyces sp. NPDC086023 TaxID=3365746 RepID=UPI0037D5E06F